MAQLNSNDPPVEDFLAGKSADTQRGFAVTYAWRLVNDAGFSAEELEAIRAGLAQNEYGETEFRKWVWASAWPWEKPSRAGSAREGYSLRETRMRGKAWLALHDALDEDPLEAALGVIYTADYVYGDREKAHNVCAEILNERFPGAIGQYAGFRAGQSDV